MTVEIVEKVTWCPAPAWLPLRGLGARAMAEVRVTRHNNHVIGRSLMARPV